MRVLLLVSSFNGLTQRVWCALRDAGASVTVELATDEDNIIAGVNRAKPDLVLCPFLKERVPSQVWQNWATVIIHPGPVGDRGPSSLDHAITDGVPVWGVTALQAVEEMDAGPIWAHRTFPIPVEPPRKSVLYNGPVADAAVECAMEVLDKAADPAFVPTPLRDAPRPVSDARLRPLLRQAERAFKWSDGSAEIVRKIRAADGFPGVRTEIAGLTVNAFEAFPGVDAGPPGELLAHRDGAVLVGTGEGSVWIGHLRVPGGVKLPATSVLGGRVEGVPEAPAGPYAPVSYEQHGAVGVLTFRAYNGAMSTTQCGRLSRALRAALDQPTRVLVVRGGDDVFCNGINLNTIEAAPDPAVEAWANIHAINEVCRLIADPTRQTVITAFTGNAGAGGVMMALGADLVVARAGIVLNPYYDIGLYGSELHTLTLPRRVGAGTAARLLRERLPVNTSQALSAGLLDAVGPRSPEAFSAWLLDLATQRATEHAARTTHAPAGGDPIRAWGGARPLSYFETIELAEMARDMFEDRSGFQAARHAFVHKIRCCRTPARLALHRSGEM